MERTEGEALLSEPVLTAAPPEVLASQAAAVRTAAGWPRGCRRVLRHFLAGSGLAAGAVVVLFAAAIIWLAIQPEGGDARVNQAFQAAMRRDPAHMVLYARVYFTIISLTGSDRLHYTVHQAAATFDRLVGNTAGAKRQEERAAPHRLRLLGMPGFSRASTTGVNLPPAVPGEVVESPLPGWAPHVPDATRVQYAFDPPSSGPHYASPATWGDYPLSLPAERWVHNLEHGGIVILYRCSGACAPVQQQLATLVTGLPRESRFGEQKVIITPYPNLDHLLRVQAWGWSLPLDRIDPARVTAFYQRHVDRGPEQVP